MGDGGVTALRQIPFPFSLCNALIILFGAVKCARARRKEIKRTCRDIT